MSGINGNKCPKRIINIQRQFVDNDRNKLVIDSRTGRDFAHFSELINDNR